MCTLLTILERRHAKPKLRGQGAARNNPGRVPPVDRGMTASGIPDGAGLRWGERRGSSVWKTLKQRRPFARVEAPSREPPAYLGLVTDLPLSKELTREVESLAEVTAPQRAATEPNPVL